METWKPLFLPFNCLHVGSTVEPPVSNHPKREELVVAQSRQQVFKSKQIMNSRQLWNLYQRNKFLRTEASRDILKFRVLEMAFPGVLFFHHGCRDVVLSEYTQDWKHAMLSKYLRHSITSHGSNVLHI